MMKIMNITGKIILLLFVTYCFIQCSDEEDGSAKKGGEIIITDSLPMGAFEQKVTNVTAVTSLRGMKISWDAPEDVSELSYYLVEWKGNSADPTLYSASSKETSLTIENLFNDAYTIGVRAVSKDMLRSEVVNASTTYQPISDNDGPAIIGDLNVSAVVGSAVLNWNNPEDEDFVYTIVRYRNVDSTNWVYVDTIPSITSMWNIYGLAELSSYEYVIETSDYIGNKSAKVEGEFRTKTEGKLEKFEADGKTPLWNIFYWSSRTKTSPAENLIDGDLNTNWHSAWGGGADEFGDGFNGTGLPQHIILDLEKEVIPSAVILYPWDGRGPKLVKIEISLEEPNDDTEWVDAGTSINDGDKHEALKYGLSVASLARYLKITILTGRSNNAIIGELDVNVLVDK